MRVRYLVVTDQLGIRLFLLETIVGFAQILVIELVACIVGKRYSAAHVTIGRAETER